MCVSVLFGMLRGLIDGSWEIIGMARMLYRRYM